jgi:hypothetical protein
VAVLALRDGIAVSAFLGILERAHDPLAALVEEVIDRRDVGSLGKVDHLERDVPARIDHSRRLRGPRAIPVRVADDLYGCPWRNVISQKLHVYLVGSQGSFLNTGPGERQPLGVPDRRHGAY